MGGAGENISCSHFLNHKSSILNMTSQLDIACDNCMGGNKKLKIKDTTKLQQCFTICLYSSLKILRYPPLFLQKFDFLVYKFYSIPQSKMSTYQTYNKKHGIKHSVT